MLLQLPGGTAIDPSGDIIAADDNGEIVDHTAKALSRLIERWKGKPNLAALLTSYNDQLQEVENMLWDVIVLRFAAYASAAQLDTLGKLVGEGRNGLGDAAYRVRIQARIKINSSLGRAKDVIQVLRMIDPAAFHYRESSAASFQISYDAPPATVAAAGQIPKIVAETRAAGVGALVLQPVNATRGGFWGDASLTDSRYLWGDGTDTAAGQVWSTADRA